MYKYRWDSLGIPHSDFGESQFLTQEIIKEILIIKSYLEYAHCTLEN